MRAITQRATHQPTPTLALRCRLSHPGDCLPWKARYLTIFRAIVDCILIGMSGVVAFTSVDSRSERNKKKGDKVKKGSKGSSDSGTTK